MCLCLFFFFFKQKTAYEMRISDWSPDVCSSDLLTLVFFNGREDFLKRSLPEGETRVVSGTVELFDGRPQMTHPDRIGTLEESDQLATVEPVYPLTAGLAPRTLAKIIDGALAKAPELPEWLDPAYQKKQGWPSWQDRKSVE